MTKPLNKTEAKLLKEALCKGRNGRHVVEVGIHRRSWAGKFAKFGVRAANAVKSLEARGLVEVVSTNHGQWVGSGGESCRSTTIVFIIKSV